MVNFPGFFSPITSESPWLPGVSRSARIARGWYHPHHRPKGETVERVGRMFFFAFFLENCALKIKGSQRSFPNWQSQDLWQRHFWLSKWRSGKFVVKVGLAHLAMGQVVRKKGCCKQLGVASPFVRFRCFSSTEIVRWKLESLAESWNAVSFRSYRCFCHPSVTR
jgi:hypothetical protein